MHLENIQADVAILVHIGVKTRSNERHLRRLVWVACRELEGELEIEALIDLFIARRYHFRKSRLGR